MRKTYLHKGLLTALVILSISSFCYLNAYSDIEVYNDPLAVLTSETEYLILADVDALKSVVHKIIEMLTLRF